MRALTLADCLSILLLERFFLRLEQCYSKTQRPFADSSDACSKLAVCGVAPEPADDLDMLLTCRPSMTTGDE